MEVTVALLISECWSNEEKLENDEDMPESGSRWREQEVAREAAAALQTVWR